MFKILVAEDDAELRQLFCRVLTRNGFTAVGVAAPLLGTVMFPVLAYLFSRDIPTTACAVIASVIILCTHLDNVHKTREHSDMKVKNYFRDILFKKNSEK